MSSFRIQKLLSQRGHCSRRAGEELLKAGRVTVNGEPASLGDNAENDAVIAVDGKEVAQEKKLYILFYKPVGCVTAVTDAHERTVMSYIDLKERVFPVGRLDKETSGLLLLTNDGDWANKLAHPRYETKKVYIAELDQPIRDRELKQLVHGIELEDGMTAPAKVQRLKQRVIRLEIHEGRNRIVRRMFKALGYNVENLKRLQVGEYRLEHLKPGEWRKIKPERYP